MPETTYVLKYPEQRRKIDDKVQWSIRQTGIYQQYNIKTKQSTWVLIFSNREAGTRKELLRRLDPSYCADSNETIMSHPLGIHIFLFQSRMDNWRLYISHFEDEVWELVSTSPYPPFQLVSKHYPKRRRTKT